MANYVRVFAVENVAQIHLQYGKAIALARQTAQVYARAGMRVQAAASEAALREIQRAYAEFNADLDRVAKETAATARTAIRREIARTRLRPDTGNAPHLRDQIRARPIHPAVSAAFGAIATGAVGIADVEVLDKLVNPLGPQYGPYWRSQEYGYRFRGKQTKGIIGGFYGPGLSSGPFRADSAYAGRSGPHPLFLPGKAAAGVAASVGFGAPKGGGLVKFRTPLKPRLFIQRGAAVAEAQWRAELAAIEKQQDARLQALTSPAALTGRAGRRR